MIRGQALLLAVVVATGCATLESDGGVQELSGSEALDTRSIELFPGRSLDGWVATYEVDIRPVDVWSFDDQGTLICKGQPWGYLRSERVWKDFELELDWRYHPTTKQAGEGGIFLRITGEDLVWPRSLEAQILYTRSGDVWTHRGFRIEPIRNRTLGDCTQRLADGERFPGEWNHYVIRAEGDTVKLWLNGTLVNEIHGVEDVAGHIGFQMFGPETHYRNVRLTPLD